MIICAAIELTMNNIAGTKLVICGHRHKNCVEIAQYSLNSNWIHPKRVEGFIDHNGKFLNRKEAYKHALECGQINQHTKWYRKDNNYEEELYSEDLY